MAETFTNSLITNSIYHLLNFEKYGSFPAAAREAALNNSFQIVLLSADFNTVFAVETRHGLSIADAARLGNEYGINMEAKHTHLNLKGVSTYWAPITVAGTKYYLMLVDNEDNYTETDIARLAEIIELAMGMWNFTPQHDPEVEFIRALRRGNRALAYTLMQEIGMSVDQFRGVFLITGSTKDRSPKRLVEFENRFNIRTINAFSEDEMAGVILADGPGSAYYGEPEWAPYAEECAKNGDVKAFYVMGTDGIEGMCSGFQLISETNAFIQLIFPHKNSFSKYEMALAENCLAICMDGGNVKKNYLDLIKPFRKGKDAKSRMLMETLETFVLDAGFSTSQTAKLMKVHANTVQYRLKKIKDLIGIDITSNTTVPGLMMALAVSRIEKEVRAF